MKRIINASTFYAVNPKDPYYTSATFPGFSIDEAVDCMTKDNMIAQGYVPLTPGEYKKFTTAVKKNTDEGTSSSEIYDSMKASFQYTKYLENPEVAEHTISYSFWYTGAYSLRDTVVAYGADYVGDYQFNLNRIAKRLGERSFYQFSTMKGKRLKSYSQLQTALHDLGVDISTIPSEDILQQECNDNSYRIARI